MITKTRAVKKLGSVKALAKALGISVHAIYQWSETGPIPELQSRRLQDWYPKLFPPHPPKGKKLC